MRRPYIICGDRILDAVTAYDMRSPCIICGDRILDAATAYNMRSTLMVCGFRIQYAATTSQAQASNGRPDSPNLPEHVLHDVKLNELELGL